jgi:single-strand DNA-binding protein
MPKTILSTNIRGFAGKDFEMRYTPSGQAVTSGSVAVTRNYQSNGEWKSETTWTRVSVWGEDAAKRAAEIKKGDFVIVDGATLTPDPATGGPRVWTGNDGATNASYEFRAQSVTNLGKLPKGDESSHAQTGGEFAQPEADIPF